MENVVVALFKVESEAYQALSQLKQDCANSSYTISQIALVKKENGHIQARDGFDTGINTNDDTLLGGLLGSFIGLLGGPLGVLLGGSMGILLGSTVDSDDAIKGISMLEYVSQNLVDGEVALIALVQETSETMLDAILEPYNATIVRYDAAEIADEVEEAENLQKELAKNLRKKLREEKSAQRKQALKEKQAQIKEEFETLKAKFSNK